MLLLRKEHVWFDRLKHIWRMSRRQMYKLKQKMSVNRTMSSCLLHCTRAFCRCSAVKSWLFLLLRTWDFTICYNVQDEDDLWRWKERNKAAEPMGMLPGTDSPSFQGLRKRHFIISSHYLPSYCPQILRKCRSIILHQIGLFLRGLWENLKLFTFISHH